MNMPFENNTAPEASEQEVEINLMDLWYNLLDYKYIAGALALVCLLLGVLYATVATPIYSADAMLQIESKRGSSLAALQDVAGLLSGGVSSGPSVDGELEIIKSRTVVDQAAQSMGLTQTASLKYFPIVGRWYAKKINGENALAKPLFGLSKYAWGGEQVNLAQFDVPDSYADQPFQITRETGNSFKLYSPKHEFLGVGQVGQEMSFSLNEAKPGRLLVTRFIANPGLQVVIVNHSLIGLHAQLLQGLNAQQNGKQSGIINLTFNSPDPEFAKNFLNALANTYLRLNVERKGQEAQQQLTFLDEQLPLIKAQLNQSEDKLKDFIKSKGTIDPTLETQALLTQDNDLEAKKLELQLKRKELLLRFTPDHPSVQAIDDQIKALDNQTGKFASLTKKLPDTQQEYLRLKRDAEINQVLYTTLLNGSQQLKVAKAGTVGNVAIIDYALKPRSPFKPQKGKIIGLAAVLGLVLGTLLAQALAFLRNVVRDPTKLEQATGLSVYAIVPLSNAQNEAEKLLKRRTDAVGLLTETNPGDPSIEALRSLRTGLQFATIDSVNKRVLITGPVPEIGKSFVSANFAAIMAQTGKKVLLIDGDMRKGTLLRYFVDDTKDKGVVVGLSDVISGATSFADALRNTGIDNLKVLVSGSVPPNPSELLLHDRFEELLRKADSEFDYVIIDSPPVLLVNDAAVLAQHCAATFVVARYGASNVRQVVDSQKRLSQAGVRVNGLIFNGYIASRAANYYGYGYGYGYKNSYGAYGTNK